MSTYTRTAEFHEKFGHPVRENPQVIPSSDEAWLSFSLILEELQELADAMFDQSVSVVAHVAPDGLTYNPDLVAIADATGDLDVVVNGNGLRHGFDMERLGEEIHRSNMSKLGADGEPIYSRGVELDGKPAGKIMKGPGFFEPNIAEALGL